MSNIIIPGERDPKNRGKDCPDFIPLRDGTKSGDPKYCDLSLVCKQMGMKSDWYHFRTETGEESFDYFCTGMYVVDPEERGVDEEVS
jgi:hypothetical protein